MRLSDAIRLGAMLRPQTREDYFADGGSCALGAAFEAAKGYTRSEQMNFVECIEFPILGVPASCPVCNRDTEDEAASVVVHLNDRHFWTREAIADWVETIEAAQPVTEQPAEVTA